ncbi:hypothetical protein ACROYT_G001632 [Oculina patagonica]
MGKYSYKIEYFCNSEQTQNSVDTLRHCMFQDVIRSSDPLCSVPLLGPPRTSL